MTTISGGGFTAELPPGWDGRIRARKPAAAATSATTSGRVFGRLHAASIHLPPDVGDYGSGAVERLATSDAFVAFVEFGPESFGTALFGSTGVPRALRPDDFDPLALQRLLPGQSGVQRFFTEGKRAFCLYVVLGSHDRRRVSVRSVNDLLASVELA